MNNMADVEKWLDETSPMIKWGVENNKVLYVRKATMFGDQRCDHCMKILKEGKPIYCAAVNALDFLYTKSGWGKMEFNGWSKKPTFCTPNHARLYAKNNNGL
jgi:hypothetical protein